MNFNTPKPEYFFLRLTTSNYHLPQSIDIFLPVYWQFIVIYPFSRIWQNPIHFDKDCFPGQLTVTCRNSWWLWQVLSCWTCCWKIVKITTLNLLYLLKNESKRSGVSIFHLSKNQRKLKKSDFIAATYAPWMRFFYKGAEFIHFTDLRP